MDPCRSKYPAETDFGGGHRASCWLYPEGGARG
jgi:hypothetical protein